MIEIFQLPFMQSALLGSILIGLLCAALGVYVVLRRMVFLSAALAQISTAGMALGLWLGLSAVAFGFAATIITVVVLAWRTGSDRVPADRELGVAYAGAFALGLLFIAKSGQGNEELSHLLQGDMLTVSNTQLLVLAAVCLIAAAIYFTFYRTFFFIAFDSISAHTQGLPVRRANLILSLVLASVISTGIQISGVLLIFSFLVIPAVIAFKIARRLQTILIAAMLITLFAVVNGLYLAFRWDLPSGPAIVAVLLALLGAAWLYAQSKKLFKTGPA